MDKKIFKKDGRIHFGIGVLLDFEPGELSDVEKAITEMNEKGMKIWRCNVCNDLHLGLEPPGECPTCTHIDAYSLISLNEFKNLIGLKSDEDEHNEQINELIGKWKEWVARQKGDEKFILNPDKEVVETLAKGVLRNEKEKGLKYCPCRVVVGDPEKDLKILCPCFFQIHETWKSKGECWCSLFIKENEEDKEPEQDEEEEI